MHRGKGTKRGRKEDEEEELEDEENEQEEDEDGEKEAPKKVKKKVVPKKKQKVDPQGRKYNADCGPFKMVPLPLGTPSTTEEDSLEEIKERITFGKIRGEPTGEHVVIPMALTNEDGSFTPIKFGLNEPHLIKEPTQFQQKGVKKKPEPTSTWTSQVMVDINSKRDTFITDCIRVCYEKAVEELQKPEIWQDMDKEEMAYTKREHAEREFKSPIVDDPYEGTSLRIKFAFNGFTKAKRFKLFDMRKGEKSKAPSKKGKEKETVCKEVMPSAIRDNNCIEGTFILEELYIRPGDNSWGFSLVWCAAKLTGAAEGTNGSSFEEMGWEN